MEFMSRGGNRAHSGSHPGRNDSWGARTVRFELFIVIVGSALLLAAVALYLALSGNSGESKKVNSSKYQAVFLNGGATSGAVAYTTYFGHVTSLNGQYAVLKDVYYLTTDQSTSTTTQANPSLTKLGCQQLHSPYDEMVINRSQIAFWENLQDNGKVVQAIKQFQQQNPNGPNCTATSSGASQSTTPATQTPTTTTR